MAENIAVEIDVEGMPAGQQHYPIDARHIEAAKTCAQPLVGQRGPDTGIETKQPQTKRGGAAVDNPREPDQLDIDVFFSHSSKDKDWVHETAARLEAEHGLVCSYDEKDFIGGKHITKNILKCVKMSRKTVLVITPDFLDSRWCEYESQVVFQEHLVRKANVAVPVLLKDCIIPDFIAHLTYLEVEDPQFWEKFVELLTSNNGEDEGLADRFSSGLEENKFNGKSLAEANTNCYCCPGYDFDHIHELLNSKGIRISQEELKEVRQLARHSPLYRLYCCYVCYQSVITFFCCVGMGIILFLVLIIFGIFNIMLLSGVDAGPLAIGFQIVFLTAAPLFTIIIVWLLLVKRILRKAETAMNLHLMDHKVILGVVRKHRFTGKQALHFLYFKKAQCLGYLERWLTARKKRQAGHVINDNDDNKDANVHEELVDATALLIGDHDNEKQEAKNTARQIIAEMSSAYVRDVCADKVLNPRLGQRHTIKGACLCQFVQAKKYGELV